MASFSMLSARIETLGGLFIALRCQNPAHRSTADLQPPGDLGFGDAGAVQSPDLGGVESRSYRAAEAFAILPSMSQSGPGSFPQNLSFELSEYGQQTGHGASGRGGQVQRLGQGNEPYAQILQFLECGQQICYRSAPAVQPPYQHEIDLPTARRLQQLLAGF